MTDHLTILKGKIEKAEAKVIRYRKSLESAGSELSDLVTTLRVLEGIANDSESNGAGTSTTMGRQLDIVRLLGVGRNNGQQPADLYASYCRLGSEDIKIDTFRTTIWRMKEQEFDLEGASYVVQGDNGSYWKELVEDIKIPPPPSMDIPAHKVPPPPPPWQQAAAPPPLPSGWQPPAEWDAEPEY